MDIKKFNGAIDITKKENRTIEYIVLHYTAGVSNKSTSTNFNICKYWNNSSSKASADFVVDEDDVYQYNPDIRNYYTYHCGGSKYNYKGGARLYGKCTNSNSIGIEMCSYREDGNNKASAEDDGWKIGKNTIELTKELVGYLKNEYSIKDENVITHFDVTGKLCPRPFLKYDKNNDSWKINDEFYSIFGDGMKTIVVKEIIAKVNLNVREGHSIDCEISYVEQKGTRLKVYESVDGWYKVSENYDLWVCGDSKYVEVIKVEEVESIENVHDDTSIHNTLETFALNSNSDTFSISKMDFDNNKCVELALTNNIYKFENFAEWKCTYINTNSLGKYLTLIDCGGDVYIVKVSDVKILV